jgi:hypothetical protein
MDSSLVVRLTSQVVAMPRPGKHSKRFKQWTFKTDYEYSVLVTFYDFNKSNTNTPNSIISFLTVNAKK